MTSDKKTMTDEKIITLAIPESVYEMIKKNLNSYDRNLARQRKKASHPYSNRIKNINGDDLVKYKISPDKNEEGKPDLKSAVEKSTV
jgi:hypothetical protein